MERTEIRKRMERMEFRTWMERMKFRSGWSEWNEWNEWSEWNESYVTFVTYVTYVTNVRNVKQEIAIGGDASRHSCAPFRHFCVRTPSLLRAHLVTYRRAAVSNKSAGKSLFLSSSL